MQSVVEALGNLNIIKRPQGPGNYVSKANLETRKLRCDKLIAKSNSDRDRITCVVIEKSVSSKLEKFDKPYYILAISKQATVFQLRQNIVQMLNLSSTQALFLFSKNTSMNPNNILKDFDKHIQEDGFLYIVCSEFAVFGAE